MNNALKHSKCTEIRLKIGLQGNGLENIRQRMDDLGGRLSIGKSEEGGVGVLPHVSL